MKKETITAAAFQKKAYAQPRMRVAEIEEESLICQSPHPSPQNEGYDEVEESVTNGWYK